MHACAALPTKLRRPLRLRAVAAWTKIAGKGFAIVECARHKQAITDANAKPRRVPLKVLAMARSILAGHICVLMGGAVLALPMLSASLSWDHRDATKRRVSLGIGVEIRSHDPDRSDGDADGVLITCFS